MERMCGTREGQCDAQQPYQLAEYAARPRDVIRPLLGRSAMIHCDMVVCGKD